MKISGFTFGHNLIESGYPIVEAIRAVQLYVDEIVVVDMQSTDGTREVLQKMVDEPRNPGGLNNLVPIKILDGQWGNQAGETLCQAHSRYTDCSGDVIIHFEADEVYGDRLIQRIVELIKDGQTDIAIHRLQVEQNFQRCRWYPEPVHRVFPRLSDTWKAGHTTNRHGQAIVLKPEYGYLWDITNCFRDNWINRVNKQAELRGVAPQYLMVPIHAIMQAEIYEGGVQRRLYEGQHWTWKTTPFNIPEILKPLVGMVRYEPNI